jgi:tetratricopeptide (TPR) repeat protein
MTSFSPTIVFALRFLAVALPVGALAWAGHRQLSVWPAAAIPFGYIRIACAYVLMCLPLSLWFGRACVACSPRLVRGLFVGGIVLGLCAAVAVIYLPGPTLASASDRWDWLVRHGVRVAAVFVLQAPWCVAAASMDRHDVWRSSRVVLADLAVALLLIGLTPVFYAEYLIRQERLVYDQATQNNQTVKAWETVRRLNALGADGARRFAAVASQSPEPDWLKSAEARLLHELQASLREIDTPPPPGASADAKIHRALSYFKLEEFDSASKILADETLASNARASQIMGVVSFQAGNTNQAIESFRRAIDLELRNESPRAEILGSCYERLAQVLRVAGRPLEAEQALKDGITRWPVGEAELKYHLGLHYHYGGRTADAVRTLTEIATLDTRIGQLAHERLKIIRTEPNSCLLRPLP